MGFTVLNGVSGTVATQSNTGSTSVVLGTGQGAAFSSATTTNPVRCAVIDTSTQPETLKFLLDVTGVSTDTLTVANRGVTDGNITAADANILVGYTVAAVVTAAAVQSITQPPAWAASTAYLPGQLVVLPTGGLGYRAAAGTSASTWASDRTNWTFLPGGHYESITSSTTWNTPTGITQAQVRLKGAGGSGGGGATGSTGPGGAGGAGMVATHELLALPSSLTITIGAGGAPSAAATAGTTGGDTTVVGTGISIKAQGGSKGNAASGSTAGASGAWGYDSTSTGFTLASGCGARNGNNNAPPVMGVQGGAAGASGSGANGGDGGAAATSQPLSTLTTGGGGAHSGANGGAGTTATVPGCGGGSGGGSGTSGTGGTGGGGANGQVELWF